MISRLASSTTASLGAGGKQMKVNELGGRLFVVATGTG